MQVDVLDLFLYHLLSLSAFALEENMVVEDKIPSHVQHGLKDREALNITVQDVLDDLVKSNEGSSSSNSSTAVHKNGTCIRAQTHYSIGKV